MPSRLYETMRFRKNRGIVISVSRHICQDNLKGRRQGSENTMQPTGFKGQEPESASVIKPCLIRLVRYLSPAFSKVSSIDVFSAIPPSHDIQSCFDTTGQQVEFRIREC
jgi:hypothetical protein